MLSWCHDILSALLTLCQGHPPVTGGFLSQRDINTLRLRQNGWYFADNILKCIFVNEKIWILVDISLELVPKVQINNISSLVQIKTWCRTGTGHYLWLVHWCITRPQWVNAELLMLSLLTAEQAVEQTVKLPVIGDARALIWYINTSTQWYIHQDFFGNKNFRGVECC